MKSFCGKFAFQAKLSRWIHFMHVTKVADRDDVIDRRTTLKLLGDISSLRHVWANIPEESTNYAEKGKIESSDNESR